MLTAAFKSSFYVGSPTSAAVMAPLHISQFSVSAVRRSFHWT